MNKLITLLRFSVPVPGKDYCVWVYPSRYGLNLPKVGSTPANTSFVHPPTSTPVEIGGVLYRFTGATGSEPFEKFMWVLASPDAPIPARDVIDAVLGAAVAKLL